MPYRLACSIAVPRFKTYACGFAFFAFFGKAAVAQISVSPTQIDPQPTYSLQVNVRAVPVDVVVTDGKGNPVHGLTKDRFEVLENGVPQIIRNFREYSSTAPLRTSLPPMPADTYTNFPATTVSSSVTVLLLDALNTPVADQAYVRANILRYLKSMPADARVAIFTLASRLRLLQGFTTEPGVLREALNQRNGKPSRPLLGQDDSVDPSQTPLLVTAESLSEFESDTNVFQAQQRMDITQEALTELGLYLQGLPGRKNVVWFSTAFPVGLSTGQVVQTALTPMNPQDVAQREMTDVLLRAQVALYPVSAAGLDVQMMNSAAQSDRSRNGNPVANTQAAIQQANSSAENRIAAESLAQATGGRAFFDSNGLKQAIEQAQREGENYYSLDYAPKENDLNRTFRKIEVKVNGQHYQVRARKGYYADVDGSANTGDPNAPLALAMTYGVPPPTGIIFKVIVAPLDPQPSESDAGAGDLSAKLAGKRVRYAIDYAASMRAITLTRKQDGSRDARVVFGAVAYDSEGMPVNETTQDLSLNLKPQALTEFARSGVKYRQLLDLPEKAVTLRLGVYDPISRHVGALEIRLKPHAPLPPTPTASAK